jgi:formylglycine-generating enzyme required for sulfatase activity
MDRNRALQLLGLDASATDEESIAAHRALAIEMDNRLERATTPALQAEWRQAREQIDKALEAVRGDASSRTQSTVDQTSDQVQPDTTTTTPAVPRPGGHPWEEPPERMTATPSEATTLRARMDADFSAGRRLPIDEILHVAEMLCDALIRLHRKGVHGAVRPEHVLLADDGTIQLVDPITDGDAQSATRAPIRAAPYLAPEQLRGTPNIDYRVDQYALGAVLYEMLTGEAPVGRVKPTVAQRPDVPRALSDAVERALAPNAADRFPDMTAFAAAMVGQTRPLKGTRAFGFVAVAVLLALVLMVAYPRWTGPTDPPVENASLSPEARPSAQTARDRAMAAARNWRSVAESRPDLGPSDGQVQADEALATGDRLFAAGAYEEATSAYLLALRLFESLSSGTTEAPANDLPRIASEVRDLLGQLDAVGPALATRITEASQEVDACDAGLRTARTDEERRLLVARRETALAEVDLARRLRELAGRHISSAAMREAIRDKLDRADRLREGGVHAEARSLYLEAQMQVERRLAWLDEAAGALRGHQAAARDAERLRSAMGPIALGIEEIPLALDEATRLISDADQQLDLGRAAEARLLLETAQERLEEARANAIDRLWPQAQAAYADGQPTAAVLALEELLVLEPDHEAGRDLKARILLHRITNGIGMQLVFLPPGDYIMGSPIDELGRDDDERQRPVRIEAGFYMATTEVTQAQWRSVMGDNPSHWKGDNRPVEQITWENALEFCRRLSSSEGRPYRLPTEAEWEYACRAGTTTPYSCGETITTDEANFDGAPAPNQSAADDAAPVGTEDQGVFRNQTVSVASFPPNAWGLYDMHGNVWEWCPDGYPFYAPDAVIRADGQAPIEGRVLRGGSWRSRSRYLRCANRVRDLEGSRMSNIGLRVVAESD